MESQHKDLQAATEDRAPFIDSRRILEFLILSGILGIGVPCATLLGVKSGERAAVVLYPAENGSAAWFPGQSN